ncbi:RNA polymerase II elongation factor ELL isoform X2 [Mustela putorius furo]|uniref:RNA polymerase II elongation factor ELL isoform X2 n=1 Tax=Mustela putorius furo TaxID=9669 RepID=A0A8U0V4A4_MUSPF|nr:RNA polymerase II elongation factor ELL isoform X2 [Mustela putorius furo]
MAALKEARSYGLSCGRVSDGSKVSVFHVKLTDSALRAFESYRASQESVSLRPSIRFQGSQGHISIPQPDCPTEARTFSFYLSNIGRDSPQGSFDCIQQYVSRSSPWLLAPYLTATGMFTWTASAASRTKSQCVPPTTPTRKHGRAWHRPKRRHGAVGPSSSRLEAATWVANVNAKDGTCTLKDCVYKDVQKDWPGYSEGDQQLLKRMLVRKLCQPQSAVGLPGDPAAASPPREHGNSASPPQKRSQPPDFTDSLVSKKTRISHFTQRAQPAINGKLSAPHGREALLPTPGPLAGSDAHLPPRLEPPRTHDPLADVSNDLGHSGRDCEHGEVAAPAPTTCLSLPLLTDCAQPSRPHGGSSRSKSKKKSKKHKDKERAAEDRHRARLPDHMPSPLGAPPDAPALNGTCSSSSVPTSTSETPDYLLKYATISSSEQRQSYKNDFNAEYSEYRDLHARIEQITRRFTQLDAQLRQLSQGSEEYETTRGQILQEYRKIKKTNTNYSQEKHRCEYLHSKLAHIKRLIAEYDQRQLQAWP